MCLLFIKTELPGRLIFSVGSANSGSKAFEDRLRLNATIDAESVNLGQPAPWITLLFHQGQSDNTMHDGKTRVPTIRRLERNGNVISFKARPARRLESKPRLCPPTKK